MFVRRFNLRRSLKKASGAVLVGCLLVSCVGPREGAAPSAVRTKNNAFTALANALNGAIRNAVATQTLTLATSKGSIGFPLRMSFRGVDPGYDIGYQTSSANCRVDASIGLVTYTGTSAGTCEVSAFQLDINRGGSGVVSFVPDEVPSALRNGLVAHWPFNDSASLGWNTVTRKVDLAATGGVEFRQQGRFGGGVFLNGRDGSLKGSSNGAISSSDLPSGNSPYTMSVWMKPTTFNRGGLVGWGSFDGRTAGATNLLQMVDDYMPASTEVGGGIVNAWTGNDLKYVHSGTRTFEISPGRLACCISSFTESRWVHVAVVYDGKARRIYYGGRQVANDIPTRPAAFSIANFRIGAGLAANEFFGGRLDDVAVWKRALTEAEVTSLASRSVAVPSSSLGSDFVPYVPTPCDQQGGYCEVGDKAPDGGTVYYVGDFSDQLNGAPMRYLSFAPTDLLKSIYGSGTIGLTGYAQNCGGKVHPIPETDRSGIGWGRRNTVIISNFCKESAADEVFTYKAGGSNDWFIPSAAELNELCKFARNQTTGDPKVGCSSASPLSPGWAMDQYHAYFLSSTQGKTVSEYAILGGSILGSLGKDWLTAAIAIGEKTGALEKVNWGGLQAWRIGRNFLDGKQYNDDGKGSQVRPIRYFAPGVQAAFSLSTPTGRVGAPINLTTSGGSGAGAVTYRVVSPGTAQCVANAERTSVTASSVGSCTVQATKGGSGSYRVARSSVVTVTVAKGIQSALSLAEVNGKVATPLSLAVGGGSGTGVSTVAVTDAGTANCRLVSPATTPQQVVADRDGTCSVTLTRSGDANFEPAAPVVVRLTFTKKDQPTLSVNGASGALDSVVPLTSSGGGGIGAVTYSVAPGGTSGCVLTASGTEVTSERSGTCKVIASKAADTEYLAATSSATDIAFNPVVCTNEGKRPDGSACQVGDTGPGGGRVFYISSTPISYAEGVSTGGTYLEVAPFNWAGGAGEYSNEWCRAGATNVALGDAIGAGANNTFLLAMQGGCSPNSAAQKSVDATIGGQSDWFLPSIKELNEVCKFAHRQPTGDAAIACTSAGPLRVDFSAGRTVNQAHWSSTEFAAGGFSQNRVMNLADGSANAVLQGRGSYLMARPIRAFGSQKPPTTVPAANVGTTTVPPSTTSTIAIDWACDNAGKRQDGSPCQVGDLGPAGGRVIHQTTVVLNAVGGISAGGRYFELAPAGWSGAARDPSMALGCSQGSTKTDLGLGASLTKAMIDACPTGSGAVQAAAGLVITRNGQVFDDWFLPSRGEIIRITETKVPGLGLLMNSEYWSSSLKSWSSTGWQVSIRFEWPGGVAAEQSVTTTARVRPIRAFG
jgi:hypothetical protein